MNFPFNRADLGLRATLERRWTKLPAGRFAGVEIRLGARLEVEDEVAGAVKRMRSYRPRRVFIDPAWRFVVRIRR